jgi:Fic family protein
MYYKYEITNTILEGIYRFGGLQEKHNLNLIPERYRQWILEIIRNENASAAVSNDKSLTNRWTLHPKQATLNRLLSETEIKHHKNYLNAYDQVDKLFATYGLSEELLLRLIKLIGTDKEQAINLRRGSRTITKFTKESDVEKSMTIGIVSSAETIKTNLIDLENWYKTNKTSVFSLILSATAHLRIAEIHPFEDGNGRVARLAERGILGEQGIDHAYLMLEDHYLRNIEVYYDLIEETIQTGNMTKWLEFYIFGMVLAAKRPIELLKILSGGALDLENDRIVELTEREMDIIELFLRNGQLSGAEIGKLLNITRQTAAKLLKNLTRKEITVKLGQGTSARYKLSVDTPMDVKAINL